MTPKEQVHTHLSDYHISFQEFIHPALFTVEQAKEWEDKIAWTHTKNIFIRDKKGNYYLITLLAQKKLDAKMFKLQSNIKDFSFATPEQLREQLKLTPGSVGIFGLINNPSIKLYIDQDVWQSEHIGRHPNDNTATLVLTKKWLSDYLTSLSINYQIVIL